ncbi:integrase [Sinomonas cyclohexanicum]|uniref:Integrase n=2 Tax=Sinomonas cyclohexanicum TaxID=322009 RepID=A0ABN6FGT8_SINCY|nr:integrase [Corynebacterium cyclohexanicum]BCT76112.1 integrase [Corynebacterium cyclohexanicum]
MDTTVARLGGLVVATLRAAGYAELTIGQYQKTIRALGVFIAGRGGAYTSELGAVFASLTTSPRTGRFSAQRRFDYRRLVGLFDALIDTGEVPLQPRRRGGGGRYPVSAGFVGVDAAWAADMAERALADATREAYGRVARGYLVYLEDHGVTDLVRARAGTVTGFLESLLESGWAKTSLFWVVSNFRPFLVFTGRRDLVDAVSLAGVRRPHPVMPVMADDDVRRVVDACTAPGVVTARDAAVTLLALLTGLRACDIIGLRLRDVDWRAGTISIIQHKTGNPVTLPMPPLLTARLADYVLTERPAGGVDHVFLRQVAPHTGLADHATIHRITTVVFAAAGAVDPRAGTRLLRHTAASRLLRAATPLPTISAVLGHASEESTGVYLTLDDERLRGCVLPAPAGPRS